VLNSSRFEYPISCVHVCGDGGDDGNRRIGHDEELDAAYRIDISQNHRKLFEGDDEMS
jgi:hypothetical protein